MADDTLLQVQVNPLAFHEIDEPWASLDEFGLTPEAILRFAAGPDVDSSIEAIRDRYRKISAEETRLIAAPNDKRLLEKIVWPLRFAKASYSFGNPLSSIALCGMVAEMAAVFLFELDGSKLNGEPITEEKQKALFGRTFEKLGQDQRVKVLIGLSVIDKEAEEAFKTIRLARKRYLHYWSQDHDGLEVDAVDCFNASVKLIVKYVLNLSIREGKMFVRKEILQYLDCSETYNPR